MFDLTTEALIPLAAAARLVPPGRNGKRCHLSTILRWIMTGAKAPDGTVVKLEGLRIGGRWTTSRQAMQRFAERLTPRLDGPAPAGARTPARRGRASEQAAVELDKIGL